VPGVAKLRIDDVAAEPDRDRPIERHPDGDPRLDRRPPARPGLERADLRLAQPDPIGELALQQPAPATGRAQLAAQVRGDRVRLALRASERSVDSASPDQPECSSRVCTGKYAGAATATPQTHA
jgi:hypothetical protein